MALVFCLPWKKALTRYKVLGRLRWQHQRLIPAIQQLYMASRVLICSTKLTKPKGMSAHKSTPTPQSQCYNVSACLEATLPAPPHCELPCATAQRALPGRRWDGNKYPGASVSCTICQKNSMRTAAGPGPGCLSSLPERPQSSIPGTRHRESCWMARRARMCEGTAHHSEPRLRETASKLVGVLALVTVLACSTVPAASHGSHFLQHD